MIAGIISMVYGDDVNEQDSFFGSGSCNCNSSCNGAGCDALGPVDEVGEQAQAFY